EVRARYLRRRGRFLSLLPRCLRFSLSGRTHPAEEAVDRPAHAPDRPSGPRGRAGASAGPHHTAPRRLDHQAAGHSTPLGGALPHADCQIAISLISQLMPHRGMKDSTWIDLVDPHAASGSGVADGPSSVPAQAPAVALSDL